MSYLGISLMAVSISAFAWYEWLGGREWVNYTDVLVLKEDVIQGQTITEKDLTTIQIDKKLVTGNVILNKQDVLNKAARHFIPQQTPLHKYFFESQELVLEEGEYISQIPVDWTLSIPDTLRRGDQIIVYATTYASEILNQLQGAQQGTTTSLPEQVGGAIPALAEDEKGELKELFHTNVAFVKDSSNKEVVTTSTQDRMDGSSTISSIEIVTTTEEFKMLEEQIKLGAKLIVMYSDSQSPVTLDKETVEEEKEASETKES